MSLKIGPNRQLATLKNNQTYSTTASFALYGAIRAGDMENVRELLLKGANVNARDLRGYTPLDEAIGSNTPQTLTIVDYLLKQGANPKNLTREWTPLHFAAYFGRAEIVKMLLEYNVDINAQTLSHSTPLHMAAKGIGSRVGRKEVVRILINLGVNINKRDNRGRTALEAAKQRQQEGIVELLELKKSL